MQDKGPRPGSPPLADRPAEELRVTQPEGRGEHEVVRLAVGGREAQTARLLRPLRRREARMARPARVRMRRRKPCVLCRRRLFGWYVRLLTSQLFLPRTRSGNSSPGGARDPVQGHWSGRSRVRMGARASRSSLHGTACGRAGSIRPPSPTFPSDFLWRTGCGGLGRLLGSSLPSLPPRLC